MILNIEEEKRTSIALEMNELSNGYEDRKFESYKGAILREIRELAVVGKYSYLTVKEINPRMNKFLLDSGFDVETIKEAKLVKTKISWEVI